MPVGGDDETIVGQNTLPGSSGKPIADLVANRYQIVRWLGGGGMGRVYEAYDTELGESVALKVLTGGLSDEAIERFRREVRLTRKIQHRNIARMFDIGEHAGDRFLTMELVVGESLGREVSSRPMAWSRLKPLAEQICAGLEAAHAAGVIHRDLKPDNILIEKATDRVVITDFGIARSLDDVGVTQVGAVIGTPRYMAPEQLNGEPVDARADVFSLGVMLFELASGHRPWSGDNAIAIAVAQATTPARPFQAAVPEELVELVTRCIAVEPADRPQTARELRQAIVACSDTVDPSRVVPGPRPATAASTKTPTQMTVLREATTLAVLPIACAPADQYLADGILDDLVDALSTTPGVRVRPAGQVRGVALHDPRELGRQLDVDHVVSVSLRRNLAMLRVSVRLIGVADGFQIWAHKTDCTDAEVLSVAESFAQGVAQALSSRASTQDRPMDPRAVDLYLRARAEMRQFWGTHVKVAADLLDEAARYAPTSAPILGARAYAAVQAWVMRGDMALEAPALEALERGLATGHGEAFLASAQWLLNHGDMERGAADLARALVRAPMSPAAHELAGRILDEAGEVGEGRHHLDTAVGLDPGRAKIVSGDIARMEALTGNWTAADAIIAGLIADSDESMRQFGAVFAARFAGWRGDREAITLAAQSFIPRMGENATKMLQLVAKSVADGALDIVSWSKLTDGFLTTERPRRSQIFGLQLLSEISMVLGAPYVARDVLGQAATLGLIDIFWLDRCPAFDAIRSSSTFVAIRRQVAESAARVVAAFRAVTA